MENQSAVDTRLWTAVRGVHPDFGTGRPDVELSEFVSARRGWTGVSDQSTAHLSDKLEWLGAACTRELECASRCASADGRGDHCDSPEPLAGQFSDRINTLRCLSPCECDTNRGD